MVSSLVQELRLSPSPLAMFFADERPAGALMYDEARWGCVISLVGAATAGRTVVLGKKNHNCLMRGEGRCHPHQKNDDLPKYDIPHEFMVLKPLRLVDEDKETPEIVCMFVNATQLASLVVLANYGREGRDAVIIPRAAACHAAYLLPYHEGRQEQPRAIVGMTDPQTRRHLDEDKVTFSVPWRMFLEMEQYLTEGALADITMVCT